MPRQQQPRTRKQHLNRSKPAIRPRITKNRQSENTQQLKNKKSDSSNKANLPSKKVAANPPEKVSNLRSSTKQRDQKPPNAGTKLVGNAKDIFEGL